MQDVFASSFQGTVREPLSFEGIGTHSGCLAHLVIKPAAEGTGLVFVRTDITDKENHIAVCPQAIKESSLCTTLGNKAGVYVRTTEHLLAALLLQGIDNAHIEIDAEEVPILDGSALAYTQALQKVGRKMQKETRRFLVVKRPVEVREGERRVALLPSSLGLSLTVHCAYQEYQVPRQSYVGVMTTEVFARDIAPARSFGFFQNIEDLRVRGLACGSSLDNAVVFSEGKPLNTEGLRFPDEIVRHKALDMLGDLATLGAPLTAHFLGNYPGHTLNAQLIAALFAHAENWAWESPLRKPMTSVIPFTSLSRRRPSRCAALTCR
ncbi:MAG: UDP-3-O-acyl-N-acetylglucosamine deacetylase [Holosporales bacterium]|jgi:UDP-3-O-[3-hydroxymyristoyl] N-acetylglucosamine deacetylase|nr:UDP-3-O-acyl-N-acetylglucosamine deacetylase [Holosporales bacterium]